MSPLKSAAFIVVFVLAGFSLRADDDQTTHAADVNRDLILDFYQMGIVHGDVSGAFSLYVSQAYRDHTSTGPQGFAKGEQAMVERVLAMQDRQIVVQRIIAEGDSVAVHARAVSKQGTGDTEMIDLYRLNGKKITDHWGFTKPVPSRAQ